MALSFANEKLCVPVSSPTPPRKRVGRDEARRPPSLASSKQPQPCAPATPLRLLRRCVSALVLALAAPSAADYGILVTAACREKWLRRRMGTREMQRQRWRFVPACPASPGRLVCLPACPTPDRCPALEHAGPGQHDVRPHRGAGPARARAHRQGVPVRRHGRRVEGGRRGAPHAHAAATHHLYRLGRPGWPLTRACTGNPATLCSPASPRPE